MMDADISRAAAFLGGGDAELARFRGKASAAEEFLERRLHHRG